MVRFPEDLLFHPFYFFLSLSLVFPPDCTSALCGFRDFPWLGWDDLVGMSGTGFWSWRVGI